MQSKFIDELKNRVLVLDGAMGTSIYQYDLSIDKDYLGMENCTDILAETRPDVIEEIHRSFLEVGCDAVETDTFGANKVVLAEFDAADRTFALNKSAAEIARRACHAFSTPDKPRFVLGSMGPGTKLPSLRQATFDILEDSYAEQVRGLIAGGVDALIIETCQDILQCKTAIAGAEVAFAEAGNRVPIIVQVTMETTGTMLVGTEMAAAMTALSAYGQVDVMGMNCATGPQEMAEHVRHLSQAWDRFLSVVPNAGLPTLVDGAPHYSLTPAELARWLLEFVEKDGVNLVGGCCGTTPAHLSAVVEAIGTRPPKPRQPKIEPSVSSLYAATTMRQELSFLIVGERSNTNGSKKFRELMIDGDVDALVSVGREQVKAGAHVLDVCVDYVGRDGVPDMETVISRYAQDVTVPIMLDSTEPPVIEAGLKLAGGKCIVNSINLEDGEEKMKIVCPMLRKYGAAVVALTIDEDPKEAMGKTAARKLEIAQRIYDLAVNKYGIRPSDIFFDCLTFPITTGNTDDRRLGLETLDGIEAIMKAMPECHSILGLSNVSFGLKPAARAVLNSVYLSEATDRGLTAAIVHAGKILPRTKISDERWAGALDLIYDRRKDGFDPLLNFISMFDDDEADLEEKESIADLPIEKRLERRIIDGERNGLEADLDEAMGTYPPLEIINRFLLDGMKVVGELFGSGRMQLPFVLQSAETMKAAVRHLEPHMEKADGGGKGTVVLATVKGDVHDIGKNLVDIILTNNGFTVHNLGIKQPINVIIDAWKKTGADVIGLSGLLVKSTLVMRDNLEVLNERDLQVPVILGGAALTRKYVEQDLRGVYKGPLWYAKDAFEGLDLANRLVNGELETGEDGALVPPPPVAPSVSTTVKKKPTVIVPTRSAVSTDVAIPTPPFWGAKRVEEIPLRAALGYLNETMLFQVQWQYKKQGRPTDEFKKFIEDEVRPIYRQLVEQCEREEIIKLQAVYGYWPANAEGDDLILFDPEDADRELQRFTFPRQQKKPFWCLSDFFRPLASGERDVAGFALVTAGEKVTTVAKTWFEADQYRDYLHLHGLGVESAEAAMEYLHRQMRIELGIADQDARDRKEIFRQGYQGSRYSFGYPACPHLEDQKKLWPLLRPEEIGVSLSDEYQLDPEQSVSAVMVHHEQAKYFSV
jgi:5-methyltetrahydrofolate--homocysteine methyltransferase